MCEKCKEIKEKLDRFFSIEASEDTLTDYQDCYIFIGELRDSLKEDTT